MPDLDWRAESLRLTAFPSAALQSEPNWWGDLFGDTADRRTSEPKQGRLEEEGAYLGGRLLLRVAPTRIDWLVGVALEPEGLGERFIGLGALSESAEAFRDLMGRWLELKLGCSVRRLAFGAVLVEPVPDRPAGYRLLSSFLPSVRLDPEGSWDFAYQINRPRDSSSGIANLKINRLSKWSVAEFRLASVALPSHRVSETVLGRACRVELDINTAAEFQEELPSSGLRQIFNELVDMALELARTGDVP